MGDNPPQIRKLRLPNDVLLIVNRYIHRFNVYKLNSQYRDLFDMGCSGRYHEDFENPCHCIQNTYWRKFYNYRNWKYSLEYDSYIWSFKSIFNKYKTKVSNLPKNY
jgi:hypothetical protein